MINFLKYRFLCLAASVAIISLLVGAYIYKNNSRGYAFTYSVEFTGGTQLLMKFADPVNTQTLLSTIEKKWSGTMMRDFSDTEVLLRVKEYSNDTQGLADKVRELVQKSLPDNTVTIVKSEAVGPGVGADLRWKSMRAVFFALLLMLFYIAWRFWSVSFAFGAVMALFHDAIIMLGVFLIFDREISINVIGAILAVLGYSINDTIVIFSQIRDNAKKMSKASFAEIINISLNQTLRRTLLTSVSTLLTVGSMFILGGEALRDFSLALLVGIFFGTYSSIYIASPIMLLLQKKVK